MNDRRKGILIALFGVVSVTPDSALVLFLTRGGVDPWVIIFWKFLFSCLITTLAAVHSLGGPAKSVATIWEAKWFYPAVVLPQSVVNVCFTMSLAYTSTSHALLIINLSPLWCAVLGRIFLRDVLPCYTQFALVGAMGCMLIIFVPEIVHGTTSDGSSASGYILSLVTGLYTAVFLTTGRMGSQLGYDLIAAAPLGSIVAAMVALMVRLGRVLPVDTTFAADTQWQFWLAMVAEGAITGSFMVALTVAPKYATGSEVALVLLLEVVLGPFWVWLIYKEVPPFWTLVGGSALIVALALHEAMPLLLTTDPNEDGTNKDGLEKYDDARCMPPSLAKLSDSEDTTKTTRLQVNRTPFERFTI